MAAESGSGLYAYALVEGSPQPVEIAATGIDGAPLQVISLGEVSAVVSEVDLEEFGEDGLRAHLENLAWLEKVAIAHDDVTRAASAYGPTAPLRLATIFRSEDSVRAALEQWRDKASGVFEVIAGRSEWSVKAYTLPAAATPRQQSTERASSGRDYLMQRRQQAERKQRGAEADQEAVQRLHEDLHQLSVGSRLLPAQDRNLSGYVGEMLLNATYLVDNDAAEHFAETVRTRDGEGRLRFTVEGPWAPYSFASLEGA